MKLKNICISIVILILTACASQNAPTAQATSIPPTPLPTVAMTPHPDSICLLFPGQKPAENNIYVMNARGRDWGTIEYKGGVLSLHGEPGHVLQEQRYVDGYTNPPFSTNITVENPDTHEQIMKVFITICGGGLFVRVEEILPNQQNAYQRFRHMF